MTISGAGAGAGYGGSRWRPWNVPGTILYAGKPVGRVTYNTQPPIPGAGWSGANWAGSGMGPYTHAPGATTDLSQAVLVTGNRHVAIHTVSGRTAGQVTHKQGTAAGVARTADGVYSDELTAQSTTAIWTPDSAFDGAVTVNSITNLSAKVVVPEFVAPAYAGTNLAQATATAMPWVDTATGLLRYNGGDMLPWSAAAGAAKCLHDGTGGVITFACSPATIATAIVASSMTVIDPGSVGFAVELLAGGALYLLVANGSAGWAVAKNVAAGIVAGGKYVITYSCLAGAGQTILRVNGVPIAGETISSPSAADPSSALKLGASYAGSTAGWDGTICGPWVCAGVPDAATIERVERALYLEAFGVPATW